MYNRLNDTGDFPTLGMDSTTRYALGDYTGNLTQSQINNPSPYNTRRQPGYPAGPDRQPGRGDAEGGARAGGGQLHVLRLPAQGEEDRLHRVVERVQPAPAAVPHRVSEELLSVGQRPRLADRAQPLAGAAPGGVRASRADRLVVRRRASAPRSSSLTSSRRRASDAEFGGFSLTMPLKLTALPLVDELEPLAARVGAVNTVVPRDGGLFGANTDVPGPGRRADRGRADDVRATGGARCAAGRRRLRSPRWRRWVRPRYGWPRAAPHRAAALSRRGPGQRDRARRRRLGPGRDRRGRPGHQRRPGHAPGRRSPRGSRRGRRRPPLFDLVYAPWPTPLAAAAQRAGVTGTRRPGPAGASGRRPGRPDDRPPDRRRRPARRRRSRPRQSTLHDLAGRDAFHDHGSVDLTARRRGFKRRVRNADARTTCSPPTSVAALHAAPVRLHFWRYRGDAYPRRITRRDPWILLVRQVMVLVSTRCSPS